MLLEKKLDNLEMPQVAVDANRSLELSHNSCCCEYVNSDGEPAHILSCCCNCEYFDKAFTDFLTCRSIEAATIDGMLLTFQDRLRIPWRGGAKQISWGAIAPIFIVPICIAIAAINFYLTLVMFLFAGIFLSYAYYYVKTRNIKTRFFCVWLVWSVIFMTILFELTVPLLELLPEENFILVLFATGTIVCFWQTRRRAVLNHVTQSTTAQNNLLDITEAPLAEETDNDNAHTSLLLEHDEQQTSICSTCRKFVPPRTSHCSICGACVLRRDHHSFWLDCCIGASNHKFYFAGLMLAGFALLLGSNLTLTAVCHPYLIVRVINIPIMVPDDCTEVFDEYAYGISFVIAVYALLIDGYILLALMLQLFVISRGLTLYEHQHGQLANRKSLFSNFLAFLE